MAVRMIRMAALMAVLFTSSAIAEEGESFTDVSLTDVFLIDETPSREPPVQTLQIIDVCAPPNTVLSYKTEYVCGKHFMTYYSSGIEDTVTCIHTKFDCDEPFTTARATQYVVVNGVAGDPRYATILDKTGGVATWQYDDENYERREYITSFCSFSDGSIKLSCVVCTEDYGLPAQVSMISNYLEASFEDEKRKLRELYPSLSFVKLANTCKKNQFFTEDED